jgi:fimbrial chaperone protein
VIRSLLLSALIALAGAVAPVQAAAVVLWPVDPKIEDGQKATALWIENKGKDPVSLQVRALGWNQAGGEDRYADQDEVVASPPIASVPAGQRQLVRIIRRTTGTGAPEQSYRLLIDELPPPLDAGKPAAPTAQLSVQMRYSIPLFTYNGAAPKPDLHAQVELIDGKRFLVIRNSGQGHARLVDLRTVSGGRRTMVTGGLLGYVLAGRTMRWPLPVQADAASSFEVSVNGADQSLAPTA